MLVNLDRKSISYKHQHIKKEKIAVLKNDLLRKKLITAQPKNFPSWGHNQVEKNFPRSDPEFHPEVDMSPTLVKLADIGLMVSSLFSVFMLLAFLVRRELLMQ